MRNNYVQTDKTEPQWHYTLHAKHLLLLLLVSCLIAITTGCADTTRDPDTAAVTTERINTGEPVKADENTTTTGTEARAVTGSLKPAGPAPAWGKTITDPMLLVIEKLTALQSGPPLHQLSPMQARKAPTPADAVTALVKERNAPVPQSRVDTTGSTIPVDKGKIHARVYTPVNAAASNPGIVYYHGGGWVIAGIDTYDASARALAEQTGAVVVAVAYRQAPEYKFPTAHNDAFAAYKWVVENAKSLKINPDKIAVAGESAGGNLAANVSIMARDNNAKMPVHQLLVYPIAGYDMNSESYQEYAQAKPLSKAGMAWFFDKYLRKPQDGTDTRIDLVNAANLKNLPPATVINAEIDPLRTEGVLFAAKLREAGVAVKSEVYNGVTHEFFGMAAVLPQAKDAQAMAAAELKKAFGM